MVYLVPWYTRVPLVRTMVHVYVRTIFGTMVPMGTRNVYVRQWYHGVEYVPKLTQEEEGY
jgi:hypothetical protein